MLNGKSSLHMRCARCSVVVLTMLLLGCGTRANVASPGTAGMQDRQGAAPATSLDEAERLDQEGVSLYRAGRYNEALPLAKRILEIREKALGPDHPEVAQSLNNLAGLYYAKRDYAQAEPLFQRALGILEKALGPNHPEVAVLTKRRATTQGQQLLQQAKQLSNQDTGESRTQAIATYEQALGIWRQIGDRSKETSTLLDIGILYYELHEPQKALDSYQQVLAIQREVKNRVGEAAMLASMGGAYARLGETQKALDAYKQALSLLQAENQPARAATILDLLGGSYRLLGDPQASLDAYQQALAMHRAQKNLTKQAETLGAIGDVYTLLGQPQKALEAYNQALEIHKEARNVAGQAEILRHISSLYTTLGQNQKALESRNQALQLQQAAQGNLSGPDRSLNLREQASMLGDTARTYSASHDYPQALNYYNQARSLLQQAGDRFGEATVLNGMSYAYNLMGDYKASLDSLDAALALQRAMHDPAREAFTLSNIAGVHQSLGEPQQAIDFYNQALETQRRMNDRSQQADTLYHIADVYCSLGDYQLSIDTYTQALEIAKSVGDRTRMVVALSRIGDVYWLAKEYPKALAFSNQALSLWHEQGNASRETLELTNISRAYEALGDYPKGLDAAKQALVMARQHNNSPQEVGALARMSRVYLASGEYQHALDGATQALELSRKLGTRLGEANVLGIMGKIYTGLQQPHKAIYTYTQELALRRQLGDRTGEAETLYHAAMTERDRGYVHEARTHIENVMTIVEDIRTKVTSQELRTAYFASVQKYYQFHIDLLMQLHTQHPAQGYDALALQASERARARSLLELLTEARADIRTGVNPELVERARTVQHKLDAAEKRRLEVSDAHDTQAQALEKEVTALLEEYRQLQAHIRTTSPRYAALTQPQPLTLAEIQQQVVDEDTMLLQYSLGEERSYLWAVTHTGMTSYELPKRAAIEAAAQQFVELLKTPTYRLDTSRGLRVDVGDGSPRHASLPSDVPHHLSQMLLQPVAEQLGEKRLLIVSDGALQYVPFAALPSPQASPSQEVVPLLVQHEIVNLPSASTLGVLRKEHHERNSAPQAKRIAVFADPIFSRGDDRLGAMGRQASQAPLDTGNLDRRALARAAREAEVTFNRLPFTRQEAEQILALVPATHQLQAFDFAASRAAVTSPELSQYHIVHFATHGILNSKQPALSGVVLSLVDDQGTPQNGFLRLHDIFNLTLPAELVVLSACETGLGEDVKGEGLIGLTRGFMYAGSPRVVVSLWSVDDEATSQLMATFYKKMLQDGLKPAAALRAAQRKMWQHTQWQAPFYWAAFTLQGEWQ